MRLLEGPPSPFPHGVKHDAHSHDSLTSGRGNSHFVSLLNSRERHTIHLREHNTKWTSQTAKMLMSTEINLRQSFLISALLTLGMDKANSGLYLLDASSMPCQLWQQQCLQTFLSVPWLRATGLDCLENRCWGTFLPSHYGRGSIPTPLVLLVHSAEMKMSGYKTKDLSENWYSISSESPQEKPYVELSGCPLPLNLDFVEASWTISGPPCISIVWWFPNTAVVRITDAKP